MITTEQRVEELELMIEGLSTQIRRNYVILHGDTEIAFSSGVLSRMNKIEGRFEEQTRLIQSLILQISQQNEQREKEEEIRDAREDERAKVIENMGKWIKIIGSLFAGGSGLQLLFEVSKLINGG